MRIILTVTLAICLGANAFAQQDPVALKYARIISPELARQHLSIIASDAYEGRETGTPGADKAAHYLEGQFKALNLEPPVNGSYFLNIPLLRKLFSISLVADGRPFVCYQDFSPYQYYADRSLNAGDLVFVGYGTDSALANTDLTGKIILWIDEDKPGVKNNTSFRLSDTRQQILKNLKSRNPGLILAANTEIGARLKTIGSSQAGRGLTIKSDDKGLPDGPAVLIIDTAMANELVKSSGKSYSELKDLAVNNPPASVIKTDLKVSYHTEMKDVNAVDVLGYLPGADPKLKDEVLVISAHYDHIGKQPADAKGDSVNNGADDDGSGTTGILEIARAFVTAKKEGHGPRRSILFLGNVGEEKGLLGSEYYTDHPVFPLASTITDLNIDMIGRIGYEYIGKPDSANYVYVIGSAMLSTGLHAVNEKANTQYTHLDLDYKYDDPNDPNRFYYRSDHYNFAKHGVPIIFYFNGVHDDYHRPGDEISKINFPLLAKRAQLVFYTAWDLVNSDARPVVDAKK